MKFSTKAIPAIVLFTFTFLTFSLAGSGGSTTKLQLRTRIQPFYGRDGWTEARFDGTIVNSSTAIIVTDMWERHWCAGATKRVVQIAQRMEPVLDKARRAGILIIHAPSGTMDFYAKTPGRLAAQNAPPSIPPAPLKFEEGPLPIDDSDEGCDTPGDIPHNAWTRQIATLTIAAGDVISDSGTEIYNVLKEHKIDTIVYMGVHANMCILARTFGIRQMSKWGLRCILVRDLTDAMYNPASRPFVSHAAGTELVIEHIERYWAPTITSNDLLLGLAGPVSRSSSQMQSNQ
jgi:nicotinamidase-related amidase